ncbi:MAG: rcc01693 family protein [Devosia sp.]
MTPFPWAAAMGFGLGVLRLSARDFWALTPRELASAWGALMGERTGPLGRGDLNILMERFPDGQ